MSLPVKPVCKKILMRRDGTSIIFIQQVTPKMIHVYRNMKETLKAFENFRKKQITFESFDFSFYEEFVEYMRYEHIQRRRKGIIKGFRVSTIGKTIKALRIFCAIGCGEISFP